MGPILIYALNVNGSWYKLKSFGRSYLEVQFMNSKFAKVLM